ncbi:Ribonuclease III domain [Arabidopsis thaliana x Arabidopsis arenosa]|uniref:Ribonuclease III domain-containing protein RNC1, chloroplastic n=1 Tax=Arabidopsis thaliana x Arabidopsis arenosa TaxID=1240361 RepID=A0A8T2APQ5_9BRAS|nr:Ribonuclease III domain [Arabidopsis thaliana x Arabidopsis arenosa]
MAWRLLNAAATGDISIFDRTTFHQSEFDKRTPHNNNVLHIAAKHQRLDFATAILNLCPSLLLGENNNGDTPLHVAATVGSFEVSKLLVNSANQVTSDVENRGLTDTRKQLLRSTNKQNDTALNVALKNRHVDVAKFFVEEDSRFLMLDMANSNLVSPLYLAIERGLFDIADHFLKISPLVSCKGPKGMNALHAAVDSDIVSPGFLRKLMEKRPEMIKEIDVIGWTPLHYSHPSCDRARARHVKNGHSRLWFLDQYVLELALTEFFLQRYPRESPGPMRERVFALIGKRYLPKWIKAASLQNLIFPYDDMDKLIRKEREPPVKSVFWALFGAIYLCYGMPEVYRVLFEVFGMDPDADECQPRSRRQLDDVDYVSVEFEGKKLGWQDIATYKPPEDALFAHPRLFRACVPPGMHRFRGNIWDFDSKPKVMQTLGYPLPMNDRIKEITEARNIELGLGLQLCCLHPSKHKFEHPRFCFERLEYVGQKIQDIAMAERLLMKHLDAPGKWLQEKHRRLLMNKFCGRYLREKRLHNFIIYSEEVHDRYEHNRRLRNPATTAVQQAIHGLAYTIYGKPDVRRLMFEVF